MEFVKKMAQTLKILYIVKNNVKYYKTNLERIL
jgi:hypothetical protein